ncbi:DUF1007 family protein [Shimia sp. R9_1]|uniref:DUF1007 family protein n=1 Tax=Shimia sp. R9_1 TaxID=2821111 RepID=UPI001ADAD18B|nr:DUF1007 family protein [Shimia sp. R9_1]MBO9409294.1 DUF1007 family protein [Shimia sp. R9_1]
MRHLPSRRAYTALRHNVLITALCGLLCGLSPQAKAHPHVFVDGGVDFVFDAENRLTALNVTWLYDAFETLYILSSYGMSLNAEGSLDEADRQELIRIRSNWPLDFNGSAHLSVHGERVSLDWPKDLDAQLIDGRLQLTFTRDLKTALPLGASPAEVAFYESTYFFAFSITDTPELLGPAEGCRAEVIPFNPALKNNSLQASLALLSREETPSIPNVGKEFADRIILICA